MKNLLDFITEADAKKDLYEITSDILLDDDYMYRFVIRTIQNCHAERGDGKKLEKLFNYIYIKSESEGDDYFLEMLPHLEFLYTQHPMYMEKAVAFTTPSEEICLNYPNEAGEKSPVWEFIYCHECMHQAWETFEVEKKLKEKYGKKFDHNLLNIASDCIINHFLRDIRKKTPPPFGIFPEVLAKEGVVYSPKEDTQFTLYEKCMAKRDELMKNDDIQQAIEDFDGQKIKPKSIDKQQNPGPPPPPPPGDKHSKDYIEGWTQAIKDVLAKKVDPLTYDPKNPPSKNDEYNNGYNDAMAQIKKGLEDGIKMTDGEPGPAGPKSDLPQIPWEQEPQQSSGGSSGDSDKNDSKDSDKKDSKQNQSKNAEQSNNSKDDNKDANKGDDNAEGGSGSSSSKTKPIEDMTAGEAADEAQEAADKAKESAETAQKAANNAKLNKDEKAAKAAQEAADKAKDAAKAAQAAADKSKKAASDKNEAGAKDALKEAINKKMEAEMEAGKAVAQTNNNTNGKQSTDGASSANNEDGVQKDVPASKNDGSSSLPWPVLMTEEEREQQKQRAKRIIEKNAGRMSGAIGKFMEQCRSSAKLEKGGLATPSFSGGAPSWNQELNRCLNGYVRTRINTIRQYKKSWARPNRRAGVIKPGQPLVRGKEEIKDLLQIKMAFYVDDSGSMGDLTRKALDAVVAICKDLKSTYLRQAEVDAEATDFRTFIWDTRVKELPFGHTAYGNGGCTMSVANLFNIINKTTSEYLCNIVLTDGGFEASDMNAVDKFLKEHRDNLYVIISSDDATGSGGKERIKQYEKLQKNNDNFVYLNADRNFTVKNI